MDAKALPKNSGRPMTRLGRLSLRGVFLLWLALIAFGIPEVIAGTGRMWWAIPGTYVLVIPLYAFHFLLLSHIAVKTGRTSWSSLYLFGVLFGLYETWITKVVWKGYPGSDGFSFGGFGDWFGVHETLGLILFYHAVISFLLPLAVLSRLFPAFGQHFPVPDWVFGKTRGALFRRLGLLFILGTVTGHNNPVLVEYVLTWVPMLVLLLLGYVFLRWRGIAASNGAQAQLIARPELSKLGVWFVSIGLLVIYVASYRYLNPEAIPAVSALLVTVGIYIVLFLLIWRAPVAGIAAQTRSAPSASAQMPIVWLLAIFFVGLLGNSFGPAFVGVRGGFAVVAFLAMMPLGVGLFVWLVGWRVILRRS